jgi:hypothetical protein
MPQTHRGGRISGTIRTRAVAPHCGTHHVRADHSIALPNPIRTMARLLTAATCLFLTACRDPNAEANFAQAMIDVGDQLTAMQQDYAILQTQLDSLRNAVARQDTIIVRLASMAGLPIGPR